MQKMKSLVELNNLPGIGDQHFMNMRREAMLYKSCVVQQIRQNIFSDSSVTNIIVIIRIKQKSWDSLQCSRNL